MHRRLHLVIALAVLSLVRATAWAQSSPGQPRAPADQAPASEQQTSDGTARSATATGIGKIPKGLDQVSRHSSKGVRQYIRQAETEAQRAARYQARRAAMQAKANASRLGGKSYIKWLGPLSTLADAGGTALGYVSVGDYAGAAASLIDDAAEALAAAGGAAATGALAGSVLGPLGTVGGAVCGVAGAVAGSVGYNAYLSPTVTEFAEQALEEPDVEDYDDLNRSDRLDDLNGSDRPDHELRMLNPFDEYLVEQLANAIRAEDARAAELAATPSEPEPDPTVGIDPTTDPDPTTAPPEEAKPRQPCPYCGEYH